MPVCVPVPLSVTGDPASWTPMRLLSPVMVKVESAPTSAALAVAAVLPATIVLAIENPLELPVRAMPPPDSEALLLVMVLFSMTIVPVN